MSVCARCRLLHTVGKIEGISSGSAVFLLLLSLVGGTKAGCTTPSQGSVLSSLSLFVLMGELPPTARLY